MPKVNCTVLGCNSSSTYGINKWKKEPCLEHGNKNVVNRQCPNCERCPYSLQRERCMDSDSQTRKSKQDKIDPKCSDRICSYHFVDGIPTKANPLLTMHMGYDTKRQKTRRPLFKHPLLTKKTLAESRGS